MAPFAHITVLLAEIATLMAWKYPYNRHLVLALILPMFFHLSVIS